MKIDRLTELAIQQYTAGVVRAREAYFAQPLSRLRWERPRGRCVRDNCQNKTKARTGVCFTCRQKDRTTTTREDQ